MARTHGFHPVHTTTKKKTALLRATNKIHYKEQFSKTICFLIEVEKGGMEREGANLVLFSLHTNMSP